ncbi:MAG: hypothetical protein M1818_000229 [Claussenomyces sp. TS43310]|nr:MAG: hypothetical protein M1818_000229 [Claussenomyces sp. TS43310]
MDPGNRGLDLEKELTCSAGGDQMVRPIRVTNMAVVTQMPCRFCICTEVLYEPLTLLDCLHTFCGACLKEWFRWQLSSAKENYNPATARTTPYTCPSCRAVVRDTKHNAAVTTLLEMFLAANPDKVKTAEEREECEKRYTAGEDVIPKLEEREKTGREQMIEDEDTRLLNEVRDLSLREVGVETTGARRERRRRDDSRLRTAPPRSSRDSSWERRPVEGRELTRRTEGDSDSESRRRQGGSSTLRPEGQFNEDRERRRSRENSRRRWEETSRTAARQIEHQSSLRSLIGSSEVESHETEEILRQIREENLLEGIDLEHLDVASEDEIRQRIAEAFRRHQREQARTETSRRRNDSSPGGGRRSGIFSESDARDDSRDDGIQASARRRGHSRSTSGTSQVDQHTSRRPRARSSHREVHSSDEGRRRRRTTSTARNVISSIPVTSDASSRPATRSQTDLSNRPRSSDADTTRPVVMRETRSTTEPLPQTTPHAAQLAEDPSPASHPRSQITTHMDSSIAGAGDPPAPSSRESPPAADLLASSVTSSVAQPSPRHSLAPEDALIPAPLSPRTSPSLSDRATAVQSAARPTSSSSTSSRVRGARYHEPSLACSRCTKAHIEYELHYNCHICLNGNWNLCLPCYRSGRGCLHWFGFGRAAWARWETLIASGNNSLRTESPHMLTANRYVPPPITEGGADGRRTITYDNPAKRLQSGAFCANCLAWANECYWRCEVCNEDDWGFCNLCVNQGKCCTHPLLPLAYRPIEGQNPPLSPRHDRQTPSSASLLTGPDIVEFGPFKPLTFRVNCDICHYPIQPSSTRYHCFSCASTSLPDRQPGDYDICTTCYSGLMSRKRISPENGSNGWRRCLRGHRMIIVGFDDSRGGQRRVIVQDLVGGRGLHEEPYKVADQPGPQLQQWSWAGDKQVRLVTTDVAASAPTTSSSSLKLSNTFPPDGGVGMAAVALWSWFPKEGDGDNELLFPKGAEIRECLDVNGDWYFGAYMGVKGLFPAPYVRVVDNGAR